MFEQEHERGGSVSVFLGNVDYGLAVLEFCGNVNVGVVTELKSKREFIILFSNKEVTPYIFKDLYSDERVRVINTMIAEPDNRILRIIQKIHLNGKINRIVLLPFKRVWGYSLDDVAWKDDIEYFVIFNKVYPYESTYLRELKKRYNIKFVLFLTDSLKDYRFSWYEKRMIKKNIFDYVFTFNDADEGQYNIMFMHTPYSQIQERESAEIQYDLYFMGMNKGRIQKLYSVFALLKANGCSALFRISEVPNAWQKYKGEIVFNRRIPYPMVIDEAKKCNCILEVLINIQSGATLRYYEAICYNKKLLTNNKNVVNLPFYNPDYIHVFEKPEDIDWEWVKERIPVDYHYDGRFSPTHLIDKIIELEERKEAQDGGEEK